MNIFIGNMDREVKKEELHKLFKEYGKVDSVTILIDRIKGEWKAFAFVDMPNVEEGLKAIKELDGHEFQRKKLIVHEARRSTRDRRNNGRGGGRRIIDFEQKE